MCSSQRERVYIRLDRNRAGNVPGDGKGQVLERVDRASGEALRLLLANKEDFTEVCRRSGAAGLCAGDNSDYEADLRLYRHVGTLYLCYIELMVLLICALSNVRYQRARGLR